MATINSSNQSPYSYAYSPRLLDRTTPERRLENTNNQNSASGLQATEERENQLNATRYTRRQNDEQSNTRRVQETLESQLSNSTRYNYNLQNRNVAEQNRLRRNEADSANENNQSATRQINNNVTYPQREQQALSELGAINSTTSTRDNSRNAINNTSRNNNRETAEATQIQAAQEAQARSTPQQAVAEYKNNQSLLQTSSPSRISDLI